MAYELRAYEVATETKIGRFGNIESARQAMLDDCGMTGLPSEEPFFAPELRIVEGWFIGKLEYHIVQS